MTTEEARLRGEFPILNEQTAYLDNAATTQKPSCVLDAAKKYYETANANPLRGLYALSVAATEAYENARETVRRFVNAGESAEIVFTRNATESLNLIAYSYGLANLKAGDEILVAISEHHSNLLPWQMVASMTGAAVRYWECAPDGVYTPESLEENLTKKTKLVAVAQISNIFGRVNDIRAFADICHAHGAALVADGAQSVPHIPVDVQALDVDFLVFSGHKMYAPMGIGVLYAKRALLEAMPPFLRGGEMIEYVTREGATWAELPHKFEAGTVNVGGAVGLAAAIGFIDRVGFDLIEKREYALTKRAMDAIRAIPHVTVIGGAEAADHHGIITFKIDGVHPHDVAAIFDADGIDVRAGHHCAQPLHRFLGVMSTTRASFAYYNTFDEVDRFVATLASIRGRMGYGE